MPPADPSAVLFGATLRTGALTPWGIGPVQKQIERIDPETRQLRTPVRLQALPPEAVTVVRVVRQSALSGRPSADSDQSVGCPHQQTHVCCSPTANGQQPSATIDSRTGIEHNG
jgi:hypothetical protein